ncbi:zf-DNL-domain-containing protein [Gonapodya prolifera JEL478]|uniref:Zf-DNL-domain-containing protein n=1 Tax=Gonapodya prolifera (strain JEL478) TaxID=1344416 RepID=A0A139AL53_GONPJ|nr:zf-DNL-domain-containing protein [Gonapodya prolifera JEL478]|eukprot:KXS17506.1 zf-DNL-domain-containing protein [Gonapodya prolifera JEL478]
MIGFTCKVCSTRSYHMISKQAYAKGVVIINCPGCKKNHLIADHLGWYDSIKTVGTLEDMMAAAGRSDEVRRVTVGVVPGGESWSVGSHKRRRTRQSHEGTGTEGGLMDGDGLVAKEGSRTEVEQTSDPSHDTDTDAESAHMQALQGAVFHKSMSGTLELLPEDVLEHERQLIAKAAQSKAARDADAAKAA